MKKYRFRCRLLPVIFFTALTLLLVRSYAYTMDIGGIKNLPGAIETGLYDFFDHVKSTAIFYITIWAAISMAYLLITRQMKIKKTKLYIPMAIYTVLVLLSFIFSEYKEMAWEGGMGRFEGTRTILCYMFMLFYTINVVDELNDALTIIIPTLCSVLIACLIGLTQLFGFDIIFSDFFKRYIIGDLGIEAEFKTGQVYQTVYNMNYVGMYLTLFIPMLLFVIYLSNKARKEHEYYKTGLSDKQLRIITTVSFIYLVIVALNVYGADSIGGVLGIGVSIMTLIILNSNKNWLKGLLTWLSVAGVVGVLAIVYIVGEDTHKSIEYFVTGMDSVLTSVDGNEITIIYNRDVKTYELKDSDGNALRMSIFKNKEGQYKVDDKRFGDKLVYIPFEDGKDAFVIIDADDENFLFRFDKEKGAQYLNPYGEEVGLNKVESIGFEGHLTAGSGRGYIWSRTLPMLKKDLIIGSGADTYLMYFPHEDYAGKYSSKTLLDFITDKPHSLYLGMIQGSGGLSLIAFLTLIVMFIKKASKIENEKERKLVSAIAAGTIGFLIAGMFNDSSVCIMPMFYGMLGTGIGVEVGKR